MVKRPVPMISLFISRFRSVGTIEADDGIGMAHFTCAKFLVLLFDNSYLNDDSFHKLDI